MSLNIKKKKTTKTKNPKTGKSHKYYKKLTLIIKLLKKLSAILLYLSLTPLLLFSAVNIVYTDHQIPDSFHNQNGFERGLSFLVIIVIFVGIGLGLFMQLINGMMASSSS